MTQRRNHFFHNSCSLLLVLTTVLACMKNAFEAVDANKFINASNTAVDRTAALVSLDLVLSEEADVLLRHDVSPGK